MEEPGEDDDSQEGLVGVGQPGETAPDCLGHLENKVLGRQEALASGLGGNLWTNSHEINDIG